MQVLQYWLPASLWAVSAYAFATGVPVMQEVVVTGARAGMVGTADSATEGAITAKQLATRPLLRASEVMEAVPGMIVTQHSGDGKANQYFLRGFNLDHGSDFATSLMGMPVNVASHGHGQGYMDLNFLIPELVANVRYRKGVYAADDGDFTTTGSARIDYQRQLPAPFADLTAGPHGFRRVLAAGSGSIDGMQLLGAFEAARNNGPWDQPEHLRKTNAVLRLSSGTAHNGYAISALAYKSEWDATEHVPERAIERGEIGRFGALSGHDGGVTHRYSLSGEWERSNALGASKASAYVIDYGLNLFSAPSGFMNGPQGDQHEQEDQRLTWGGQVSQAWYLDDTELTLGLQLRQDRIDSVGLYDTVARVRTNTVRQDRITDTAAGLFIQARTQWRPWLRTTAGLRYDRIHADVTAAAGQFNLTNGGSVHAGQASPKLGVVFGPFGPQARTELYANWGTGFHSNDVRGATSVMNPADGSSTEKLGLFSKARGAEAGLRTTVLPGWSSSLSVWHMDLGSELVFVGDEGVTEARGASTRHGIEWSNYYAPNAWLIIDGDIAWSQARFKQAVEGGGTDIPNAIPLTASLGIGVDYGGPWFGGLRMRYLGAYALEETGAHKSSPFYTANLKLGYRIAPRVQFSADILNLFDRKANDIEYWGGACTRNEQANGECNGGIDGRLIHPLEPRTLRVNLRVAF
ncbi:TonB-dependent receptor [Massilia sp. CF038]|uniref:TonB-dependent receptor n=1 Tax=Massilia sp. CF038 TaxID=1881045 RepID=UPI0009223C7F|nr:TonB-dependent receptor [Massilia sp. CF038]SHG63222.1 Outer membrane receptor proteins, mostly Fe transport [Massilia sp. CF038]